MRHSRDVKGPYYRRGDSEYDHESDGTTGQEHATEVERLGRTARVSGSEG